MAIPTKVTAKVGKGLTTAGDFLIDMGKVTKPVVTKAAGKLDNTKFIDDALKNAPTTGSAAAMNKALGLGEASTGTAKSALDLATDGANPIKKAKRSESGIITEDLSPAEWRKAINNFQNGVPPKPPTPTPASAAGEIADAQIKAAKIEADAIKNAAKIEADALKKTASQTAKATDDVVENAAKVGENAAGSTRHYTEAVRNNIVKKVEKQAKGWSNFATRQVEKFTKIETKALDKLQKAEDALKTNPTKAAKYQKQADDLFKQADNHLGKADTWHKRQKYISPIGSGLVNGVWNLTRAVTYIPRKAAQGVYLATKGTTKLGIWTGKTTIDLGKKGVNKLKGTKNLDETANAEKTKEIAEKINNAKQHAAKLDDLTEAGAKKTGFLGRSQTYGGKIAVSATLLASPIAYAAYDTDGAFTKFLMDKTTQGVIALLEGKSEEEIAETLHDYVNYASVLIPGNVGKAIQAGAVRTAQAQTGHQDGSPESIAAGKNAAITWQLTNTAYLGAITCLRSEVYKNRDPAMSSEEIRIQLAKDLVTDLIKGANRTEAQNGGPITEADIEQHFVNNPEKLKTIESLRPGTTATLCAIFPELDKKLKAQETIIAAKKDNEDGLWNSMKGTFNKVTDAGKDKIGNLNPLFNIVGELTTMLTDFLKAAFKWVMEKTGLDKAFSDHKTAEANGTNISMRTNPNLNTRTPETLIQSPSLTVAPS